MPPKISAGALDRFRREGRRECCEQIRNKSRKGGGRRERAGDMSISENKGEGRKESHLNCAAFDFKIARNESLVDLLLLLFAKGPPPQPQP